MSKIEGSTLLSSSTGYQNPFRFVAQEECVDVTVAIEDEMGAETGLYNLSLEEEEKKKKKCYQ